MIASVRPGGAFATLLRGTAFLGRHPAAIGTETPVAARRLRAKVLGNCLRELDRFLNLLIDEVAAEACPGRIEPIGFAGQRNTANKLRTLYAILGAASPDHHRLRALGRSRDCLFHCGGVARRGDRHGGTRMTAGWPPSAGLSDAPLMSVALGDTLVVTPVDLRRVCDFYEEIAAGLVALNPRSAEAPAAIATA
ncbi:hypothetical protein [Sphingomonas quercus]|uniref:Uncharacterized protein n=1 Tax=Sphingomonas quercus TaxID=2842451 RepID=A0ABS6BEP1_9SPHN|nr:hypothetical protein [Sphingomonas quercus]MBU3076778.1 hypothetical protein [Sphingomonas quercus]